MSAPIWAARHNYYHHSNTRSKDRAKVLFDKCHVRPLVKKAWDIYRSDCATEYDREDAYTTLTRLDQSLNQSNSAKMFGGVLVQAACDQILLANKDPQEAIDLALQKYMDYTPRSWDEGKDADDWSNCQLKLSDVIRTSVAGLREAMAKAPKVYGEVDLKGCLPNNKVEHFNKPDYVGVGDLKTKWPRRAKTKKGFSEASLPKDLSGPFEMNNVYQVAGGWHINNRQPVWLLYANGNDYALFNEDNCEQLQPEFLDKVVKDQSVHHKVTEKMLMLSDETTDLFELVSPNWDHISWSEPPSVVEEAKRVWKL